MRISFISPTLNMSGGVKVISIYAEALARMGHSVCVVSPPPRTFTFAERCRSLLRGRGWPAKSERPASPLDRMAGVDIRVLDRPRPVVDGDLPDADVVIATWWETAEWVNALAADKGAKVYFIQGHEIFPHLPVARCRATYRLPFHKVVVASWLKRVMSTEYGDDVVDVVPNSVDKAQFFAPARDRQAVPTVGFLYSTTQIKGVDVTLAALSLVRQRFPALRVVTFGTQPPCEQLPLPEGAEFRLSPPQNELRNIYSRCDVWVSGSRSEGFNLTAMEAMACRTPVVSTRTGWPEEAIKPEWNGALVDSDDPTGLAKAIEGVLSLNDDEWRALSAHALATVESASWDQSAKMFERALEHACSRSARGEIDGRPADHSVVNLTSSR